MPRENFHRREFRDSFLEHLEDCGAHSFGPTAYPGIEGETAGSAADDLKGADVSAGNDPEVEYLDEIFVGYRWHDTMRVPALFPFGHGLSYTTFALTNARLSAREMTDDSSIEVSVDVTNIGSRAGSETIQLYIADDESALPRPAKELKGFEKIRLEPGETATVTFVITAPMLSYYDDRVAEWVAEPGTFRALVGSSSADIAASLPFKLSGVLCD